MKNALIILALAFLAFSCGGPEEVTPEEPAAAPALVSTSPADGIGGIEGPSLSIVFTFDQSILCTSASLEGLSVDGGAFIEKAGPAGATLTVVVSGLARGKQYTVTLPAGTVRGFKPDQKASAAITFRFSTKEPDPAPDPGSWESAASAVKNMGAGWNLGNTLDTNSGDVTNMWFEAYSDRTPTAYETGWGQPVTTRALIHMFKEAGFNAIRVPVTWYPHMGTLEVNGGRWNMDKWLESTDYRVDPAWMARVREVVGYVLDEGMYCILNVHHDTGDHGEKKNGAAWLVADKFDAAKDRYAALWQQIASPVKIKKDDLVRVSIASGLAEDGFINGYQPSASYPFTVTYEYTMSFRKGFASFPSFIPVSGEKVKLEKAVYTLQVPSGTHINTLSEKAGEVRKETGKVDTYQWNLPVFEGYAEESLMPSWREIVPFVAASPVDFVFAGVPGNQSTWKEVGAWCYGLSEGTGDLPEDFVARLKEMTASAGSDLEKVRILYDYLREQTRYVSIQLGIGGYKPFPASQVQRSGFGDCKGLSNYMKAMLGAVGVASIYTVRRL